MFTLSNLNVAGWIVASFPVIRDIILILIALACVIMVIAILFQTNHAESSSAISGESSNSANYGGGSETYYSKHKGGTIDEKLNKITKIMAIVIVVLVILFFITKLIYNG